MTRAFAVMAVFAGCCRTPCEGVSVEESVATSSHQRAVRQPFDGLAEEDIDSLPEESSLSPQAPTTPKAVSFQVELDRGEGLASIGLQLDASDQKLCLVTGVKADGLVHRWNTQNPGQKVLRFDRLLQVNGEPGPADALVAKACSSTKLLLAFQRPRTFQARVQKRGRALGLRIAVNSQHPSAIAVIQVEAEGAMEEWNRSNPNLAVQASDRFLEVYPVGESAVVEGEAATASGMLRTLQNSDDVCLTVLSWRQDT